MTALLYERNVGTKYGERSRLGVIYGFSEDILHVSMSHDARMAKLVMCSGKHGVFESQQ